MTHLPDLLLQVGHVIGWDASLFGLFAYQLFWPERLHFKNGTKLQRLLREPNPLVVKALEAVYKDSDNLSRQKLVDTLNGDVPRVYDFEVEDIKEHPGGD